MNKIQQEKWEKLWHDVVHGKGCDKDEIDKKIKETADKIKRITDETDKPLRWLWSGGKDSQALHAIMRESGENVRPIMFTPADELQFTDFVQWAKKNGPDNLSWCYDKEDMDALIKAPLFDYPAAKSRNQIPKRCETAGFVGITGRREEDNQKAKSEYVRDCVMWDWKHAEILAAVYYRQMPLPPCYFWFPNGWVDGPMPWYQRSIRTTNGTAIGSKELTDADRERGWRETYRIEPSIVERAKAAGVPGASEFLETLKA